MKFFLSYLHRIAHYNVPVMSLLGVDYKNVTDFRGHIRVFTGRVSNFSWLVNGGQLRGSFPKKNIFWNIYPVHLILFIFETISYYFQSIAYKYSTLIRTGAWHPLLNPSGCPSTRYTCSNKALSRTSLAIQKIVSIYTDTELNKIIEKWPYLCHILFWKVW